MSKINFRYTQGFTLIEVLVSMIVLAIGLLGLASLQGISLKNNQDAYLYSQANILAYEMSDRMRANKIWWNPAGSLVVTIPTVAPATCNQSCNSTGSSCTPSLMAASDFCYWQQKVQTVLSPNATATIQLSKDVSPTNPLCPSVTNGDGSPNVVALCLTTTWSRTNQNLSASMTNSSYSMEVTP